MGMRWLRHPVGALRSLWFGGRALEARRLLGDGEHERAARLLAQMSEERPGDAWVRSSLEHARVEHFRVRADRLWQDGQEAEAWASMMAAAVALPSAPDIRLWLAAAAVAHHRYGEAAERAAQAVALAPEDPAVLFRAAHPARWGDVERARSYVERVKTVLADSDRALDSFVFLDELPELEGLLLWSEGEHHSAVTLLRRARDLHPRDPGVVGELAEALIELGEEEEARTAILAGLEHAPHNERLGELLARLSDY